LSGREAIVVKNFTTLSGSPLHTNQLTVNKLLLDKKGMLFGVVRVAQFRFVFTISGINLNE